MKVTTFESPSLGLMLLSIAGIARFGLIASFTPGLHSRSGRFGHSPTINIEESKTYTQLNMKNNNNRARNERNFEEMMGDDWRTFRARLVAQEKAEVRHRVNNRHAHESYSSQHRDRTNHFHLGDRQIVRQSHLADLFAGAIGSIFPGKQGQNGDIDENLYSDGDFSTHTQDVLLDGEEFAIGATGAPSFICGDPFASEEEIVATAQYVSAARQLDKHRWAHPISHIEPGCVLVANERLGGMFHQTVVLIIDHNEVHGSTGIVINRYVSSLFYLQHFEVQLFDSYLTFHILLLRYVLLQTSSWQFNENR